MALYEAVETLPEKHRMPLMLFAIGGYDINEIACDLLLQHPLLSDGTRDQLAFQRR